MGKSSLVPAIDQYVRDVLDGTIPTGEYVRLAVERHVRDLAEGPKRGLIFDEKKAKRAIDFASLCCHSKGEWAGKPIELAPWQQFIHGSVFGWIREKDGYRRFRTIHEEVARKNGKSTKSSVTGLYLLIADGESGAEIYTAATKRDQARIIHQEAVNIVKSSPDLNKLLKVVRDNIAFVERFSKFVPLSADHKTHDGLNIHGGLLDETHALPSRELYDVIETATGSRRQPLIWDVTTAGVVIPGSIAIELREYGIDVLRGTVDDDTFFAFIATIDEGDDWRDPKVWAKANPNLGISVYPDDLERKIKKARTPAAIANFKCKHLNVWTTAFSSWLSVEQWDQGKRDFKEEDLYGKTCYAGLDLASTTDLTALSLVFPDEETGTFQTLQYYWIPKDTLGNRKLKDQLRNWVGQGWIEETEGATTDYQLVRKRINELTQKFQIAEIAIDRWNATQLANQLMDDGATVFGFGQGFSSMSDPTKRLEALILDKQIYHNGNPVTRWMVGNVTVKMDAADNYKPDKSKSSEKIDGIVATIMGLGRALMAIDPTSVYEKKDPLSI